MYEQKELFASSTTQSSVSSFQVINIQSHVTQSSTQAMHALKTLQRKFTAEQLSDEDLESPRSERDSDISDFVLMPVLLSVDKKSDPEIDPQQELQLITQAELVLGNPQLTWFDSLEELIADLEN